jgi:excisionase family DNA binding protein
VILDSDRLAGIIGAALLEAVDRAVAARLPELLTRAAPATEGFVTVVAAAEIAGVAPDTLRAWITRGLLEATRPPGTKAWRIRPAALEALMRADQPPVRQPVDLAARRQELGRRLAEGVDRGGGGGT